MKLDYNCLRDVLLTIEANSNYHLNEENRIIRDWISFVEFIEQLPQYDSAVIGYAIAKCAEAGFIRAEIRWPNGTFSCFVYELTYVGHEFLEKIRPVPIWKKVLQCTGKIGSFGTSTLARIAETLIQEAIASALNSDNPVARD